MRKRVFKIIFALLLPVVMILTAGFFSFNETSIAFAANSYPGKTGETDDGDSSGSGSGSGGTVASDGLGGLIYVGNNSTFNMTSGSLSGGTAKNGGGVYVSSGGTFNLSGGTIMGNVASANGNQIYNDGTFTMTGGTVGQKTYLTRVDENGVKNANGNYVLFGSYPQTIKASDVTIDETNVDANGYYLGSDGERYMKQRALSTQSQWFTDSTEIVLNTDYYFKVKPILWKITKTENGKALLVSKDILDNRSYGYNNGYYGSSIRFWLNNDFYNTAFSSKEQELIEISTIECQTSSGNTTVNDKIYLLSSDEVNAGDIVPSSEQPKIANDIVRCKGAILWTGSGGSLIAKLTSYWFCRDVYDIDDGAYMGVYGSGGCGYINGEVKGIVPALLVNIGDSSNVSSNGIYNTGDLNIYGGTVYDDIFSSSTIKTKVGASINGIINLSTSGQIIVLDYAGETPNYTICVDSSRTAGILVTFKGVSTSPDISKINVYGYNANGMKVVLQESASGFWVLELVDDKVEFPSTWQTEIASSKYMTSPVDLYDDYYGVALYFDTEAPSDAEKIGTLSTGIEVYRVNYSKLYFVSSLKIYAPEDCSNMFASGAYSAIYFYNFKTENVKSMKNMFALTDNLSALYISTFNTQNVTDMSGMFNGTKLASVNLKNFNTSNVTTMSAMFARSKITSLDLSSFDTSKVTDMSSMFWISNASTIDLSGFNTSNVTNMSSMFDQCNATSINVKNFDTSKVTNMSYMFNWATKLTTLDISGFDTSNVTDMRSMFKNSSNITSIELGSLNAEKVLDMSDMFNNLPNLSTIDLSNFKTSQVKNMSNMFYGCSSLKSIDLSLVKTATATTMSNMFDGCSALTNIVLSSFDTAMVTDMSSMFKNCSSLQNLNLSNFNTSVVTTMANMFQGCTALKTLNLSSFDMSKTTNFANMLNFGADNAIETFETPYGNTSALPITTSVTLYNESGAVVSSVPAKLSASIILSSVPFPVTFPTDWKTQLTGSTMTTTIVADDLTSITFEKLVPTGYTQIGTIASSILVYKSTSVDTDIVFVYAGKIKAPVDSSSLFSGLTNLVNLTFNNFDTSDTTNMNSMFLLAKYDSSNFTHYAEPGKFTYDIYNTTLETLDLSMFDTSKVTNMGYMFMGCKGLKTLDCSSFDMSNVDVYYCLHMFDFTSDNKIKTLKLPYNNTTTLAITTGSTLIDENENTVNSVPANNKQGLSYVASKSKIKITFVIEGRADGGGLVSIYDKNGNKIVYFDSPEQFQYIYTGNNGSWTNTGMKQVGQTIEVDEGTTWYEILNEYGLVCTDTRKELSYGSVYGSTWTTDQMRTLGDHWNQSEDNPTFDEDITLIFYCAHTCMSSDTEIDVYDEKRKRRIRKKLRDISYKDKLLVWNFDKGCFDLATPLFITKPQTTTRYTMVWFSDGSSLRLVGADDTRRHRVFCLETGKFEYVGNGAKVGMTTYNDKGEFVKITKIEFINEKIEFMNIITNEHFNCFANGILTSCKLSNMYPIKNMKYDKTNKTLNTRDMFGDVSDFYYKALRLAEQPLLNTYNNHSEYIDYKQIYEIEWENSSFKRDEK